MKRIQQIKVGQTAEIAHLVSREDIEKFVELTGDDNRLHTDASYAARTGMKKPVAHGMLGAAFVSTVIGTKLPGDGALWFSQSFEFLLPVRVGDKIRVCARVLSVDERSGIVELQTDILNQHGQRVTAGLAKVKIVEPYENEAIEPVKRVRVALVVGGSGGIGAAVAKVLAADGFNVAVHYFSNEAAGRKIAGDICEQGGVATAVGGAVTDENAVAQIIESVVRKYGTISVLVNCVSGKIVAQKLKDLTWRDFEGQIFPAVLGAHHLTKAILPIFEAQGHGKIINIGSMSVEAPSVDWLPYITAKAALAGYTRALAFELAPKGIQVNLVAPGMTETDQIADIPERVRLFTAAKTPLRRLARPDDVAGAVSFLASDRANFLAGETIRVNGGQVMI